MYSLKNIYHHYIHIFWHQVKKKDYFVCFTPITFIVKTFIDERIRGIPYTLPVQPQLLLRKMDHPLHLLKGQPLGYTNYMTPFTSCPSLSSKDSKFPVWLETHVMIGLERVNRPFIFFLSLLLSVSLCQEFVVKNFKGMKQPAVEGETEKL